LHLLAELDLSDDGLEVGLVDSGEEPTVKVDEGLSEASVQDGGVEWEEGRSEDDVSKGDSLSDDPSAGEEVLVQDVERLSDVGLSLLGDFDIVWNKAPDGIQPGSGGEVELSDGEIDPLVDQTLFVGRGSEQVGRSLSGDVTSDRIAFPDGSFRGFEDWDLAKRILLQELRGLVVLSEVEFGHFDFNANILGGDQRLVDAWVVGVAVDFLFTQKKKKKKLIQH